MPSPTSGSGRRDLVWLGKHPATPLLYAASTATALAALGSKAYDWESSLDVGLGAGTTCAVFILPVYLCAALGLAHDARIEQSRVLGGWNADSQRLRMLASMCALAAGAVLVAVAVSSCLALAVPDPSPDLPVDVGLTRSVIRLALTVLAAALISTLVAFGRGLLSGVCAGCGIILCHVLVQFTPDVVGQTGLKLLWPFTGATAVSEAGANYSSNQALVAASALFVWALSAIARLSRAPIGARAARGHGPRTRGFRDRPALLIIGCLVTVAAAPTLVRWCLPALPPSARPSMLLQRSQHVAPEQVAHEFFAALQRGEVDEARRHVLATRPDLVSDLPRQLYVPGPGQSFQLERVVGIDRAEVTGFLVAGTYHVCLLNQRGTWRIDSIGTDRC